MKSNGLLKSFALMVVITFSAFSASAGLIENVQKGFFDVVDFLTPYRGPKKDISTLIITSNYVKSKMLAELIQFDTKQPYILLPAASQDKIFFCPAHGRKPQEIKLEKLERFIKFVNPRQILVLGDKSYVSEKYLNMIDDHQTLMVVSNKNWNQISKTIEKLLNLSNLSDDFKRTLNDWQSGQRYVPEHNPVALKQIETVEIVEVALQDDIYVAPAVPVVPVAVITDEIPSFQGVEEPTLFEEPELIIPDEAPMIIEEK